MKTVYRLLSLNLVLILLSLFCIFPISAVSQVMTVDGVSFGMDTDKSGTGWSYKSSDKTLTLDGYKGSAICASGDLVIYSKNEVEITASEGDCGISVSGSLTLNAADELSVTGSGGGAGIYAKSLELVSGDDASVTLKGGKGANAVKANTITLDAKGLSAIGGEGASAVYFGARLDVNGKTDATFLAGTGSDYAITYKSNGTYNTGNNILLKCKSGGATIDIFCFSGLYGDVDLDGDVTISDAVLLAQYLAQWEIKLSNAAKEASDVFYDGEIDTSDAVLLAQYLAKWEVRLGKE